MAFSIIIAEPSYLLKRGLSALIADTVESEIVFIDDMHELHEHLDINMVYAVFINNNLLVNRDDAELFFRLKEHTKFIALTDHPKDIKTWHKFDAVLDRNSQKQTIVPVIEQLLESGKKQNSTTESLLSKREQEVLKKVALGYTNQEIADNLFISKHTVISHRKNLTSKLGIKTVSGLTVYAVLNGLIPKDRIR